MRYELIREKQVKQPKPKRKPPATYVDITSIAVNKQHTRRYLRLNNGAYFKVNAIVAYNYKTKKGFFMFVTTVDKHKVKTFLRKTNIKDFSHDKAFLFRGLGFEYYTMRHKQHIEHIFGFKRAIYQKHKRKPYVAIELLEDYREYFKRLGLEEVKP